MSSYQGPNAAHLEAQDNRLCTCGHLSLSHGSFIAQEFAGIGNGPCGFDHIVGTPDCGKFTEKERP